MKAEVLNGSTAHLLEWEVDYKNQTAEIKDAYEDTLKNRLKHAAMDWLGWLIPPFLFSLLNWMLIGVISTRGSEVEIEFPLVLIGAYLVIWGLLTLLNIPKSWDTVIKRMFAIRSGKGERNKVVVTGLTEPRFVLRNIDNFVVDYKATGDFATQLNKIITKKEPAFDNTQATVKDVSLLEDKEVWNTYFLFDEIPKNGEPRVEWI